ncbi:MAG: hypothetical protein ING01_04875, partial [Rhodobacter sp.]|nr:hypothetical protein [Rhodobacter sp.]
MRKPNRPAKTPRPVAAAGAKPAKPADLARLEQDLRARLAAKPEDKAAWQQLAGILANSARPKEAVEAFAKAVALGAPVGPICTPYAIALSTLGRHKEAAELVAPVQARKPKDFALTNLLGVMLKRAARFDEAAAMLKNAQRLDPKSASPWQNLGNVEEARGN